MTGGNGFVASHLINRLQQLQANVIATSRHKKASASQILLRKINNSEPTIEFNDLLNLEDALSLFEIHEIEVVYHLAASSLVSSAADSPYWSLKNNIISTINILEAARLKKIECTIIASSDKAYGDHSGASEHQKLPYRENYDLKGVDIYSVSKMCGDAIAHSYAAQFKIPVVVTRCCNIYGPGDLNFSRLVPRTIIRLLNNLPPVVHMGNNNVLREYCYIDDVVDAFIIMAEKIEQLNFDRAVTDSPNRGEFAFNIGNYSNLEKNNVKDCEHIQSVSSLMALICELSNLGIKPLEKMPTKPFIEIGNQFNDSSKLFELGYAPKFSMKKGLMQSFNWYNEHKDYCTALAGKYLD